LRDRFSGLLPCQMIEPAHGWRSVMALIAILHVRSR